MRYPYQFKRVQYTVKVSIKFTFLTMTLKEHPSHFSSFPSHCKNRHKKKTTKTTSQSASQKQSLVTINPILLIHATGFRQFLLITECEKNCPPITTR